VSAGSLPAGYVYPRSIETLDHAKAHGTDKEIEKAFTDAFKMLKDRIEKELL
jgi:hypothetical protein